MGAHELAFVGLAGSGVGTALGVPMIWPPSRRSLDVRLLGAALVLMSAIAALISARLAGLTPASPEVEHAINVGQHLLEQIHSLLIVLRGEERIVTAADDAAIVGVTAIRPAEGPSEQPRQVGHPGQVVGGDELGAAPGRLGGAGRAAAHFQRPLPAGGQGAGRPEADDSPRLVVLIIVGNSASPAGAGGRGACGTRAPGILDSGDPGLGRVALGGEAAGGDHLALE